MGHSPHAPPFRHTCSSVWDWGSSWPPVCSAATLSPGEWCLPAATGCWLPVAAAASSWTWSPCYVLSGSVLGCSAAKQWQSQGWKLENKRFTG